MGINWFSNRNIQINMIKTFKCKIEDKIIVLNLWLNSMGLNQTVQI